ncbi:hypothetical protein CISIN_1g0292022mg, partial [Citrus sinensis]
STPRGCFSCFCPLIRQ